jgi:putative phage-type endonuclease
MLKLIKTELTKHNGSHTLSKVSEIIKSISETNDEFKQTKIKQILAKYSNISDGKLIIDTSNATDNTYDDLKIKIENNVRSSDAKHKLIVSKKNSESENSSEELPQYKEKKPQEVLGPRMDYLRKYIKTTSSQKPSDFQLPPKSKYVYGQKKYTSVKRIEDKYGPYGTQWVHDTQNDDKLDDSAKKSAKVVDRLMEIEYPAQRSEAWFKQRDGKITASDGGTVLGENKYEYPYKFYFKKVKGSPFTGNEACYHGKKFENVATMIYSYRMNVNVIEFGLVDHPKYKFLGASPDGIVGKYKLDGVHKTSLVGRMLEIKVPFRRKILQTGEIKDGICPIYYWDQVQLQLECCDLELCDFWQCNLNEYSSREEFIADTDTSEPFRSQTTGFEKGVLIQLLPRNKIEEASNGHYLTVVYDNASFIYPSKIEMSPEECDLWIAETLSNLYSTHKDHIFDKIIYWKLIESKSVTIERDRAWFKERLPILQKTWDNVEYLRSHKDRAEIAFQYIESLKETEKKKNEKAIYAVELICNPPGDKANDKTKKLYDMKVAKLIEDTVVVMEMESSDED